MTNKIKKVDEFRYCDEVWPFYLKQKAKKLGIKPCLVDWESGLGEGYTTEQTLKIINDNDPKFDIDFYNKYKDAKFLAGKLKLVEE